MRNELLRFSNIKKYAPSSSVSLQSISFYISDGEVVDIIGPTDSGKNWISRILAGRETPDAGQIYFRGEEVTHLSELSETGDIEVINTTSRFIPQMSVADNLMAFSKRKRRSLLYRPGRSFRQVQDILREFCLDIEPDASISELTDFQVQLLSVVKAYLDGACLVVLQDLPVANNTALSDRLDLILRQMSEKGVAILNITNKFSVLSGASSRVYVIDRGYIVAELDCHDKRRFRGLRSPEKDSAFQKQEPACRIDDVFLTATWGAAASERLELRRGEAVCLVDQNGTHAEEIAGLFFGGPDAKGKICLDGKRIRLGSESAAACHGIYLIHEQPFRYGRLKSLNISDDLALECFREISRFTIINRRKERYLARRAADLIRQYNPNIDLLHFGEEDNPFWIMAARAMVANPRLMIFIHPLDFLDERSRASFSAMVSDLSERGTAVLIVAEPDSLLAEVCTRVIRL